MLFITDHSSRTDVQFHTFLADAPVFGGVLLVKLSYLSGPSQHVFDMMVV